MRHNLLKSVILLIMIILPSTMAALSNLSNLDRKAEMARLEESLNKATTPQDSIEILNDIFDLKPRATKDSVGKQIIELSLRSGDSKSGLDAVRNIGNLHIKSDSLIDVCIEKALEFPPSEDRDESVTFLRMLRNTAKVRFSTPAEKDRDFQQIMRQINSEKVKDKYEHIVLLHALCIYIADGTNGNLLSKYMDRLGELVEELRSEAYSIRNCYYVQAALTYSENQELEKSVDYDRKLLKTINDMEAGYVGMGRWYRNYDSNRYVIYTRLLSNFPVLSDKEVEKYYAEAMDIVSRDTTAAHTNAISGVPQIYYAMYKHNYPLALELIDKYIDKPYNVHKRDRLLRYKIEAAEALNDKQALLEASREYNDVLEKALDERVREKYKELQIVYDIQGIKDAYAEHTESMQRRSLIMAYVAVIILLILLAVLAVMWRNKRRLAFSLERANEALRAETENLHRSQDALVLARDEARKASSIKSIFIKNISSEVTVPLHTINEYTNLIIDCSEASYKPYLKPFAELIAMNSELLGTILNDMLSLSEIDSDTLTVICSRQKLEALLEAGVNNVKRHVPDGVEIVVEKHLDEEIFVKADPNRVVQIMLQLLSNALKATPKGMIKISYVVDAASGRVSIYVTDGGHGIAAEHSEKIFERFVKLDHNAPGVGVGLTIARYMARLMNGDLRLDTSYTGNGARFMLTLPLA